VGLIFGLPSPPEYSTYSAAWKDPIATLHYTLRRLEIDWAKPTIWTHNGTALNLEFGTPSLLLRLLKPAHRRAHIRVVAFPGTDDT
jgi:hypothetical protein